MGDPIRYGEHQRAKPGTPCVLCGETQPRPVTDHCHAHGWVRGALCPRCNSKMAYIDRRATPRGRVLVALSEMVAYVSRCPGCPPVTVDDIGGDPSPVPQAYNSGADVRRIRVDGETWRIYAEITGDGGRSADIREYVEWRLDHPTTPLPGKRRGPVKKDRPTSSES